MVLFFTIHVKHEEKNNKKPGLQAKYVGKTWETQMFLGLIVTIHLYNERFQRKGHAERNSRLHRSPGPLRASVQPWTSMQYPWRIHGAAIYGDMDPIHIPPFMLAYIYIYTSTMDPNYGVMFQIRLANTTAVVG